MREAGAWPDAAEEASGTTERCSRAIPRWAMRTAAAAAAPTSRRTRTRSWAAGVVLVMAAVATLAAMNSAGVDPPDEARVDVDVDAAAPLPTKPTTSAKGNVTAFARMVKDKRFIVVQTDTRLRGETGARAPFTKDVPRVSVLAMHEWARRMGYGYVFLDQTDACFDGPDVHTDASQRFSYYWCKIPALVVVLRLLELVPRHAKTDRFVLLCDTDALPGQLPGSLEEIVQAAHAIEPWSILLNSDKGYYWYGLARDAYPATNGGINSGVVLLRESRKQTRELVDELWFSLTKEKTPVEAQQSLVKVACDVSAVENDAPWPLSADAQAKLVEAFRKAFGTPKAEVQTLRSRAADGKRRISFDVAFKVPNVSLTRDLAAQCCGEGACFRLLPSNLGVVKGTETCQTEWASTLTSWPGDQDRLNYLAQLHPDEIKMEPTTRLAGGCLKGTKIVGHWCRDASTKLTGANDASERLQRDLKLANESRAVQTACADDVSSPLLLDGCVRREWDAWLGAATLEARVPTVVLPASTKGMGTRNFLARVVDVGAFDVRLGCVGADDAGVPCGVP